MSEDEIFAAFVCAALCAITWLRWAYVVTVIRQLHPAPSAYLAPWVAVPLTGALVFAILARFASHDVRDSGIYIGFYLLMTAAATGLGVGLLERLGLSLRDDVIERRNPAACLAWSGAIIGLGLAFAGANVGDGPGWWVVVFSGGLSVGALLLLWIVLDRAGHAGEAILIERNEEAGLRVAGWFVAVGAITGRAAAGDWISARGTVDDFIAIAWVALVLTVVAAWVESSFNHRAPGTSGGVRSPLRGAIIGLLWVGIAAGYLIHLGHW
jgi:hypothetical protein